MTFKEWSKKVDEAGHITETGKCVICGEVYHNYGKATWGYWDEDPINYPLGEDKRCCEKCYREKVEPARAVKYEKVFK